MRVFFRMLDKKRGRTFLIANIINIKLLEEEQREIGFLRYDY